MEEEMYDLFAEPNEADEFDIDYEYDAPQYFDFTQPAALEAEQWFESAGSYPPSPFIIKLNWKEDLPEEKAPTSWKSKDDIGMTSICDYSDNSLGSEVSSSDENNRGFRLYNHIAHYSPKNKTKSLVKSSMSRSSTLMKPTASHLAKQNQPREVHSNRVLRRFKIDDKSSQNSSLIQSLSTKRQKLEAGYLRKIAHLNHQTFLQHKASKKAGNVDGRPKVTIPRGPELETAHRAERHKSKKNAKLGEHAKSNVQSFKAHPLNRKILETPPLPFPRKSTPHVADFQDVDMPNYKPVLSDEKKDSKRPNLDNALKQEEYETAQILKSRPLNKKEFNYPTDKRFRHEPPIDLFSKLSLASEAQGNARSESKMPLATKGSKENTQCTFHRENERFGGKLCQCGSDTVILEIGAFANSNSQQEIGKESTSMSQLMLHTLRIRVQSQRVRLY